MYNDRTKIRWNPTPWIPKSNKVDVRLQKKNNNKTNKNSILNEKG